MTRCSTSSEICSSSNLAIIKEQHWLRQSRWPNNVNKKVPGLVFTGSSTLPGVGVPMVLVSGKLAAQRVEQYAKQRRG